MDAGDVIAIVAAVISAVSVYFAWRAARSSDRSAEAAETSAGASVRSADASEVSAHISRQQFEQEMQDRAQAELDRRLDVWEVTQASSVTWYIKLVGAHAYYAVVETGSESAVSVTRWRGETGPMFRNSAFSVQKLDDRVWDRKVTMAWRESDDEDAEVLRKDLVL